VTRGGQTKERHSDHRPDTGHTTHLFINNQSVKNN
jgi:hypothetical protein